MGWESIDLGSGSCSILIFKMKLVQKELLPTCGSQFPILRNGEAGESGLINRWCKSLHVGLAGCLPLYVMNTCRLPEFQPQWLLTGCVISDKLLSLSVPQFPLFKNMDTHSIYLIGLL